jgi:uncharacterized protein YacL
MNQHQPIVAGVMRSVSQADHLVQRLLNAGFHKNQITVMCSDRATEAHFREFEHQEPAGFYTFKAMIVGAACGALLGLLAMMAMVALQVAEVLAIASVLMVPFATVLGGFVGAMLSRSREKELANFYDQELTPGDILVAAEDHSERADTTLAEAEHILAEEGVKPLELVEG